MKKIVTHDSSFHADDVFAVATLQIYLDKIGENYKVVRSRDKEIINSADYVVDTGHVYDDEENRFDHHQESFKETGFLDIPYSSFGLVWKHYGKQICESGENGKDKSIGKHVWTKIRNEFVTVIDANDNGMVTASQAIKDLEPIDPETFIFSWRPHYNERTDENLYKGFVEAVKFAKGFLERQIKLAQAKEELRDEFELVLKSKKNIWKTDSLKVLVLPKPLPWKEFIDLDNNDFDFVVHERENGHWMAVGVPVAPNSMKVKVKKQSWLGLDGEALSEKTGIPDMVFYHKTGYILVAKTKESVLAALEKF